jgi:beta-phosphoglucomutase
LERYKLDFEKGTLEKKKKALMKEWVETKQLQLLPYAREAVEFFAKIAETGKVKMAVCSGSIKEETLSKLKGIGLFTYFPVITGGDEVKHGKPAPDVYLLSCKKLELKPEECLAFEDSEYGLRSAKSAGLTCFAIPSEFSVKQDFSQADKVFKNLKEVVEFFRENGI